MSSDKYAFFFGVRVTLTNSSDVIFEDRVSNPGINRLRIVYRISGYSGTESLNAGHIQIYFS